MSSLVTMCTSTMKRYSPTSWTCQPCKPKVSQPPKLKINPQLLLEQFLTEKENLLFHVSLIQEFKHCTEFDVGNAALTVEESLNHIKQIQVTASKKLDHIAARTVLSTCLPKGISKNKVKFYLSLVGTGASALYGFINYLEENQFQNNSQAKTISTWSITACVAIGGISAVASFITGYKLKRENQIKKDLEKIAERASWIYETKPLIDAFIYTTVRISIERPFGENPPSSESRSFQLMSPSSSNNTSPRTRRSLRRQATQRDLVVPLKEEQRRARHNFFYDVDETELAAIQGFGCRTARGFYSRNMDVFEQYADDEDEKQDSFPIFTTEGSVAYSITDNPEGDLVLLSRASTPILEPANEDKDNKESKHGESKHNDSIV